MGGRRTAKSRSRSHRSSAASRQVSSKATRRREPKVLQKIKTGKYYVGAAEDVLSSASLQKYRGKVNLILTSPPFPLNKKKNYGNLQGDEYLRWMKKLAPLLEEMLAPDGSLVVEIGNCWEPNRPIQSLLPVKTLLALSEIGDLRLIQEFICYNPSRLPSPAQWVTVERLRAVDSFTHVWWFAKRDKPNANNARVLRPYSEAMKQLLARGTFNHGPRPSHHRISKRGFLKKKKGAIPHNVFELEPLEADREVRLPNVFSFSNTASNDYFSRICKSRGIEPHPARMPVGLAAFFIQFLTRKGGYVLDPFAGSNTTGFAATLLGRRWIAVDAQRKYVTQSKIRFSDPSVAVAVRRNFR